MAIKQWNNRRIKLEEISSAITRQIINLYNTIKLIDNSSYMKKN